MRKRRVVRTIRRHKVTDPMLARIRTAYQSHAGQLPKAQMEALSLAIGLPRHSIYYHARRNGWTKAKRRRGNAAAGGRNVRRLTPAEREALSTNQLRELGICCCCRKAAIHPTLTLMCWACHTGVDQDVIEDEHRCTYG